VSTITIISETVQLTNYTNDQFRVREIFYVYNVLVFFIHFKNLVVQKVK